MEELENFNAELVVRFGKAWYKLVGISTVLGVTVALGTFLAGREVFKDTFAQTQVLPLITNQKED